MSYLNVHYVCYVYHVWMFEYWKLVWMFIMFIIFECSNIRCLSCPNVYIRCLSYPNIRISDVYHVRISDVCHVWMSDVCHVQMFISHVYHVRILRIVCHVWMFVMFECLIRPNIRCLSCLNVIISVVCHIWMSKYQ